jgi:hypothetical protein
MWRNIICQSVFQVILLLIILFKGADMFGVPEGIACAKYSVKQQSELLWSVSTFQLINSTASIANNNNDDGFISCRAYKEECDHHGTTCLLKDHDFINHAGDIVVAKFSDFEDFESECLTCVKNSYYHGSLIFNTFIFCQLFNEYNARKILDEINFLEGLWGNHIFLLVSIVTLGCQIFLIELGGDFVKTSPLSLIDWLITIGLASLAWPVGILMRFIPIKEDPNTFFTHNAGGNKAESLEGRHHHDDSNSRGGIEMLRTTPVVVN